MKKAFFLLTTCLMGCIGTDYMDDAIVGEKIIVSTETVALMIAGETQVTAMYFNKFGIPQEVELKWQSSNVLIAQVNAEGKITAKALGQALIQPFFEDFLGPQIQVTVVNDPSAVATVKINTPLSTNLGIGIKVQLNASVKNFDGIELPDKTIEWFSENSAILTVSQTGLVEAVGNGVAGIHAKSIGVKSNSIDFTVTGLARTGAFIAAGGYKTSGNARLEVIDNKLTVTLSDNFDTDFALGTFIYLANSTNGGVVRSSGLEIAQIFTDGGKTFVLSPSIGLNDYRYVIVLCKPASVTFGFADLK